MDVISVLEAPCSVEMLFGAVEDLGDYPRWLSIVARAARTEAEESDMGPAWHVDLRGRLGPLARSKRLRMVRTVHNVPTHARFERREIDGRSHSAWELDVEVAPLPQGAKLTMLLHYGGSFGGSILEGMLRDEIEESRPQLLQRLMIA